MNIAQILERSRRLFPDKPALIFEGQSFTYRELDEMSNRVANSLTNLGVARGDRVAMLMPNIPEFVGVYFGIQKIGAIAVCINTAYKADETQYLLDDSGASVLVTTAELRANVCAEKCSQLKHILIVENNLRELMANASPIAQAVACAPNDPATILYTTATGGVPKGATLSHANAISNMRVCTYTFRLHSDDRVLLFLSAFYKFAQNTAFLPCFDAGATLVLHRDYGSAKILKSIVEDGVTVFFGVPTIFTILFDKASAEQMRSVRLYISAAAPLPVDLVTKWHEKFGVMISDLHGMTEASANTFNHFIKPKPGSIGTPLEGVEMQVVDEQDHPVETGTVGEIVVRGPHVMLGYWNRPADTRIALRDGWLHTGDLGRMDEDGYFYFEGYLKDMVNVAGHKVYGAEVEQVLCQHPAIAEAAIYGVPDAVMCEQVRASIVLKPGTQMTAEEVMAFCEQHMADFKVPKGVEFVAWLPPAPNARVLKQILREQFQASLPADESPKPVQPLSRESVQNWVIEWLARKLALDPNIIETHRPFVEYGFTSLMAVSFALDLAHWSGRSISPLLVWNFPTIDALTRHLQNDGASSSASLKSATEKTDLTGLSDDELAKMLATEIDLAKGKIQ